MAMGVLFILPVVSGSRNLYHGVAVLTHHTGLVPFATGVRVVFALLLLMLLTEFPGIPAALMGGLLFVGGLSIESIVTYLSARGSVREISQWSNRLIGETGTRDQDNLTVATILLFFAPLVFTSLMQQVTMPAINTRIGFGALAFPEVPVAAFAAGSDLGSLLLSPLSMLHQASMMFGDNDDSTVRRALRQFCIVWIGLITAVTVIISFGPAGRFLLERVIGVSEELSIRAVWVMRILSFTGIIRGYREYLWGICMKRRETKLISSSKTISLVVSLMLVFVGIRAVDWYPSAVVAAALVVGEAVETGLIWRSFRYYRTMTHMVYDIE